MLRTLFSLAIVLVFTTATVQAQQVIPPDSSMPDLYANSVVSDEYFDGWLTPSNWEGGFELGLNGSQGNAENFNFLAGLDLKRKTALREVIVDFNYALTSVDAVQTQNFWQLNLKNDRSFEEGSPWSIFTNFNILADQFQAFDYRVALNSGIGYKWIDNESALLRNRVGFGASREFGGPNDDWTPELVLGVDFMRQITTNQKVGGTVDYFPNISDFADFRLVADVYWEMLIDPEANLSLKLNVIDRYDSTPEGAEANDIFYNFSLLWKF